MDGDRDAKKIALDGETGAQQIVRSIRFCEAAGVGSSTDTEFRILGR